MSVDMSLFLQNVQVALENQQYEHATCLLDTVIKLAESVPCSQSASSLDVGIGLHRGQVRQENEDCVLALRGLQETQTAFGLFVVCDGMGGHADGQEAARVAIQTLLEQVIPVLISGPVSTPWMAVLVEGITCANQAIYRRNQVAMQQRQNAGISSPKGRMGTTITAALLFDETAYIANVGDSRTYQYDNRQGLCRITRDHSVVASLVEQGLILDEERYAHPDRNKITRALGIKEKVEIDTFCIPFQRGTVFLLCSDGLWEMTRDSMIQGILAVPWTSASTKASQLIQLANDGDGGGDNISCLVIQHLDCSEMETMLLDPVIAGNSTTILRQESSD